MKLRSSRTVSNSSARAPPRNAPRRQQASEIDARLQVLPDRPRCARAAALVAVDAAAQPQRGARLLDLRGRRADAVQSSSTFIASSSRPVDASSFCERHRARRVVGEDRRHLAQLSSPHPRCRRAVRAAAPRRSADAPRRAPGARRTGARRSRAARRRTRADDVGVLNASTSGMLCTPSARATCGLSSTLTLARITCPPPSAARRSSSGPSCLRSAPRRPEVDDDGDRPGLLDHLTLEVAVGDVLHPNCSRCSIPLHLGMRAHRQDQNLHARRGACPSFTNDPTEGRAGW